MLAQDNLPGSLKIIPPKTLLNYNLIDNKCFVMLFMPFGKQIIEDNV